MDLAVHAETQAWKGNMTRKSEHWIIWGRLIHAEVGETAS